MNVWVIVRTQIRHELQVYRAMLERPDVEDAWLPLMPGMSRVHRKTKHRREWWKPTMATVFFAKLDPLDVFRFEFIPYFRGIERRWSGEAIEFAEEDLMRFRKGIDLENRELLRIGRRIASELQPPAKLQRPGKPSRRISRPSLKQPRQSDQLAEWTYRLIQAQSTPPCETV